MILTNYHTHTIYCDGSSTPEEMIIAAIDKGFTTLGFSGHSANPLGTDYSMKKAQMEEYFVEVNRLKKKYDGKIKILCGVEQDYYSNDLDIPFDYVLGAVHHIIKDGDNIIIDWSREHLIEKAKKHYGGDIYALIEHYYELERDIVKMTRCDIIGHLDLVMKFNGDGTLFDETHPRYVEAVEKTLAALVPTGKIFEINTGAIARGYRVLPYPSLWILKRIKELGGRIMINSDAHFRSGLDYAFDLAERVAFEAGFTEDEIVREL